VTDFEREVYQSMSGDWRCLLWILKTADYMEFSRLLTPADLKLLRKTIEEMVQEG